jgi:hypothetical protein
LLHSEYPEIENRITDQEMPYWASNLRLSHVDIMNRNHHTVLFFLCCLSVLSAAQHQHGDDDGESTSGAVSDTGGHMTPFFHITPGDTLLFEGWVPRSGGAVFGACLGLFFIGIGERWVSAVRRGMETVWRER